MLRRVDRAICTVCKRSLPRAAARCPWCSYGSSKPIRSDTSQASGQRGPGEGDEGCTASGDYTPRNSMKEVYA